MLIMVDSTGIIKKQTNKQTKTHPDNSAARVSAADIFSVLSMTYWILFRNGLTVVSTDVSRSRSMKVWKFSFRSKRTSSGSSGKHRYLRMARRNFPEPNPWSLWPCSFVIDHGGGWTSTTTTSKREEMTKKHRRSLPELRLIRQHFMIRIITVRKFLFAFEALYKWATARRNTGSDTGHRQCSVGCGHS